ncbi:MAG: hypothetical protein MPK30_09345, partial [Gammaproteobacteria bacterium]|nr:hypothetical protein [Gammaproteobacteria bacterium]
MTAVVGPGGANADFRGRRLAEVGGRLVKNPQTASGKAPHMGDCRRAGRPVLRLRGLQSDQCQRGSCDEKSQRFPGAAALALKHVLEHD